MMGYNSVQWLLEERRSTDSRLVEIAGQEEGAEGGGAGGRWQRVVTAKIHGGHD